MSHSLTSIHIHAVFSTKGRQELLKGDFRTRMHAYLGGIVRELGVKPVIVNGTADHVHLLIDLPPHLSLSDCMRVVKTNSSRWAGEQQKRFAWQRGFSAFSVSTSAMPAITKYIAQQEQHHSKMGFDQELRALLKKHGVMFDERDLD